MRGWIIVRLPDGSRRRAFALRRMACQVGRGELIEAVEVEWPGIPAAEPYGWPFPAIIPLSYCEEVQNEHTGYFAETPGCQTIAGRLVDGEMPMP